jgi:hypothetical protein
MRLYLAGPMSNIPQFNYPLFHEAAAWLRSLGYTIVSPADEDPPEVQAAAMASSDGLVGEAGELSGGQTYGQRLGHDIRLLVEEVDGIVLLPRWEFSRGARVEAFAAVTFNRQIFEYVRAAQPVQRGTKWITALLIP